MPESMSIERRKMLRLLGAKIELTNPDKGMKGAIKRAQELKEKIYSLICDKAILKYQTNKLGIDDVIETDEVVDEL